MVRHELGHHFTSDATRDELIRLIKLHSNGKGDITDCATWSWWKQTVSEYAGTNYLEAIAESFALVTSSYYEVGTLPNWLEDFIGFVLREV